MKYRLDYVTNSSSSSGVVLVLNTNQKRREIKYERYGDPGWWNFSTLSQNGGFCICESELTENQGTLYRIKPFETNKLKDKLVDEDLSTYYQSIFYYLILTKLREYSIQYSTQLDRVITIDNQYAYIYNDELLLISKSRMSDDIRVIVENIRMITEHQNDIVTSVIELSSNLLIRKLFDLHMDEVFKKMAEYQYIFVEEYVYTNMELDLSDLSVQSDERNPAKRLDPKKILAEEVKVKLEELTAEGCFVDELLEQYSKKNTDLENFEIMVNHFGDSCQPISLFEKLSELLGDIKHFRNNQPNKFLKSASIYGKSHSEYLNHHTLVNISLKNRMEIKNVISDFEYDKSITPQQAILLNAIYDIQMKGKRWEEEIDSLVKIKNRYEEEYKLKKEEKLRRQNQKRVERLVEPSSKLKSDPLFYELNQDGKVPEKLKSPQTISIETAHGLVEISYKPKAAINRIQQMFIEPNDGVYSAKDLCYAERDDDGYIVSGVKYLDESKVRELAKDFLKICLLFTNVKVMADIINKVPKKKLGELYLKRKTHIAMLDLSTGNVFPELIATNIAENKISIEIKSMPTYKQNYEKSMNQLDNKVLLDELVSHYNSLGIKK